LSKKPATGFARNPVRALTVRRLIITTGKLSTNRTTKCFLPADVGNPEEFRVRQVWKALAAAAPGVAESTSGARLTGRLVKQSMEDKEARRSKHRFLFQSQSVPL